jgi:predicted  nucleic acid-binding Zn-ribbon protein
LTGGPLQALLGLQDADTALDQLRHRRSHLPPRAELSAIEQEMAGLDQAAGEAGTARDQVAEQQARAEAELAAIEERAEAVNRRLYGGTVTASRELQAMAADVESLKARASVIEDQVLELMEVREPLEADLAALASKREALDARRQEAAAALAVAEADVDQEMTRLAEGRAQAARSVPADLQTVYDRLRTRLGGVAVARLVGNHCDGCHLTLPAMELDRIRHLPEGEVLTCEQCGRILVRESPG